jgi:hypothetical protein
MPHSKTLRGLSSKNYITHVNNQNSNEQNDKYDHTYLNVIASSRYYPGENIENSGTVIHKHR